MKKYLKILGFVFLLQYVTACQSLTDWVMDIKPSPESQSIPSRPFFASSGSGFISKTKKVSSAKREEMVLNELKDGNIPSFLRQLVPVQLKYSDKKVGTITGTIWVMPDYLSIGSNWNYIRMPMNPVTAQKIADQYGFMLPTKKMVDQIYAKATIRLKPYTMKPGSSMSSSQYYEDHNKAIEKQINGKLGQLVAGHKKDIVITNRLKRFQKPKRVAIYGWHQLNWKPIQPLSTVHDNKYADYSHGVRLVSQSMIVNGRRYAVKTVLTNPRLAPLISDEGTISTARYLLW